jgi:hypothetical protein
VNSICCSRQNISQTSLSPETASKTHKSYQELRTTIFVSEVDKKSGFLTCSGSLNFPAPALHQEILPKLRVLTHIKTGIFPLKMGSSPDYFCTQFVRTCPVEWMLRNLHPGGASWNTLSNSAYLAPHRRTFTVGKVALIQTNPFP